MQINAAKSQCYVNYMHFYYSHDIVIMSLVLHCNKVQHAVYITKLYSSITLGQVMYIYMYTYAYINISCLLKRCMSA